MKKGFTLIEMAVVLGCITLLSAMIVPNVFSSVDSTKLKADIHSAMIIQNALELYMMESGSNLSESTGTELITKLKSEGYIKSLTNYPQSNGAKWVYDKSACRVSIDISTCSTELKKMAKSLNTQDLIYVTGIN